MDFKNESGDNSNPVDVSKGNRNYAIDFWRVSFTLLICCLHFESPFLAYFDMLDKGSRFFKFGYLGVEFFYILSGFLLAKGKNRYDSLPRSWDSASLAGRNFVFGKIKRFVPVYVFVISLFAVYTSILHPERILEQVNLLLNREWDLLGLSLTGMGRGNIYPFVIWFYSSLCIVGYFAAALLVYSGPLTSKILAPFSALFFYSYILITNQSLDAHTNHGIFLLYGTMRAIAGLSLGIVVYEVYFWLAKKKWTKLRCFWLNVLEIVAIYKCIDLLLLNPYNIDNSRVLIYFPILIIMAFLQKTVIAKAINRKVFSYVGMLTMGIYIVHPIVIDFMIPFVGKNNFAICTMLFLIVVTILSAVINIMLHLLGQFTAAQKLRHDRSESI